VTTNEITGSPSIEETFSPGQVLAEGLTLKQKITAGDTGIIWLAHDGGSGEDVTLLFLPAAVLKDARVMDELRIQVKLNRQLIHPHIVRTHDLIEEEGWAAISSDAVEAETLASLLAKKKEDAFDVSQIQPWTAALCQTLDDAHRASLLHRDLVPQNILLAKNGEILIANFGTNRIILDAVGRIRGPGKIDEHVASMSPQQLDGELPARWDDIYSLGVLIYQLLTGKPPYYSGDILPQIRKTIPPSISARRTELGITGESIPENWEKVVAACLEKHTLQRPKSMREVGVKLGAEAGLAQAPQVILVAAESSVPTAAVKPPLETKEARKIQEPAKSIAPKELGKSKEALIEDIVWRKPGSHPAPGEPPSFKHLLEQVPGDQRQQREFPIRKAAIIGACVAAILVLLLWHKEKPAQKSVGPVVSPTPAAAITPSAVPASKPTPMVTITEPAKTPAILPSSVPPEKIRALEEARKTLDDMTKGLEEKTKAQQQAEADAAAAKSALDAKTAALDAMKKAADDAAILRKQREDEEAKAAADATKAAADADAAQKAAVEKARIAADATKAKEQIISQIKEQDEARQKADAEMQPLQKAADDKQAAADDAAKAAKDAEAQLQLQQVLVKQTETEALQPSPTPAPQPSAAAVLPLPSGTSEVLVPITPDKTPAPVSIEAAEALMVKNISDSHQAGPNATPTPAATPSMPVTYVANPKSQIDHTLTNSLGMKFQPMGDVLFCVWLTRVQDFEVFARETHFKSTSWQQPGFKQGPDHPVVYVTWNDAMAFCKWLTDKERKAGILAPNQIYRLPTDLEWSKAVGLPEETGRTPDDRDVGVKDVYPWGKQWPPPAGAGNYDGEETGSDVAIKGYDDGYVFTSPVGSFAMNQYGLYDMGGNAWEWCMDWFNGEQKQRVLRGASWYNGDLQLSLLSSCRWPSAPDITSDNFGFRCVIATEGKSKK
jgi:serine/threonine protein kinase